MSDRFSNFVELLSDKANQTPDKVAFTFLQDGETESACLTYRQLDIKALAIAAQLQLYKAQGERVLLLYQPGLEFIAAFLGCLYAGAIATPAYPPRANRSIERILAIIADAEAKFALTTGDLIGNVQKQLDKNQIKSRINLFATDILDLNLANNWQKPEIEAKQIAFLQYTSGSTGVPKGVMVSHGNLIANSATINHCFQNNQTHRAVSWLPPYHDMGLIGCILQPIYVGVSMYLMPPVAFLQRPYRWLKAISHYRAHTSGAPNFAYDLCVNQISPAQRDSLDLSCWQLAFTGAEPVRAETLSKFAAYFASTGFKKQAFYPCYGMAESTLLITGGDKHESVILADFDSEKIKQNIATYSSEQTNSLTLVSCGRNVVGQKLLIVNPETCRLCAAGEIGEIWVKSPSVAQGYWRRPELTHFSFNASPLDREETGFLRTGDLGFLQDDELYVTGRLKDLIIIRGKNHYPQDIELTLDSAHEAIRPGCSAAFSVEIEGEEKLVVVQEIKRSYWRSVEAETVIKAIRQVIARKHELQVYAVLLLKPASIPKTSSGKIQRHACREGFLTDSLKVVAQWRETEQKTSLPPSYSEFQVSDNNLNNSPITNWLIAKVAEKVGIAAEKIKIDEPFANYGLDSLQAVKISAELEDWLKIKLSPTIVYDYPSIATLSQYLQAKSFPVTSSISATPLASAVPIAIIGMGCRLPGAENPEAFWQLLSQGIDAIRRQSGRWQGEEWGGYLDDVDLFDPQFFGISPREAQRLDPQQRLLLEVVWEALEYGGIAPDKLAGSKTGVFVGISSSDYSHLQFHYGVEVNAYSGTGNAHSIAANRLSYILDLHGPSLTVDTACSSSLVAVHLACQSLKQGECDQAIVGGVNLLLSPELTRTFRQAGMMASDGRCKTFDNAADGYVRGEGCGAIILKRLEEAVQDGDRILAVIKGSAVNQDGKSNGLTAPNGIAQQQVIRQALANAGVEPEAVSYIETHGTGTSLGDPIEVNSLKAVFANSQRDNCYLGAVKTNIGHLEAAAGIAGLIKAILCLQNQQIVPNLHFSQLNSYIDLQATGLKIPTKLQAWQSKKPLTAGISSFGFGGTNAHLILSQLAAQPSQVNSSAQTLASRSFELLTLSAKEPKALTDLAAKYANYLQNHPELCLADLCYTANTGRSHFDYRLAVVASSTLELQQKLANISSGEASAGIAQNKVEVKNESNNKIAFLFTGQGSQYPGMGYELYCSQPVFRQALERCEEILSPYLDIPLLEILYPKLSPTKQTGNFINRTLYTQPAIFALEYALAQLWLSWGIEPSVVMGHSVGEYVAACIAGVFSLEEGLKLIASRAKLMENLPTNGEMAAVFTDEDTIKQLIEQVEEKEVSIAAINSPQNTVISGESKAVKNLLDKLRNLGIKAQKLNVSHAFHSALMQPILAEFTQIAESVTFNLPRVKIISNLTGSFVTEKITKVSYWTEHIIAPVKFLAGVEQLAKSNYEVFLEVGAKPILLGMARQCLPRYKGLWLPSLRPKKSDWQQIFKSLANFYLQGFSINWQGLNLGLDRKKVILPTYSFQRQSYWLEGKNSLLETAKESNLINQKENFYQVTWQSVNLTNKLESFSSKLWLIFADQQGIGEKLAKKIQETGSQCLLIYQGKNYQRLQENYWQVNPKKLEDLKHFWQENFIENQKLQGIIYLWSSEKHSEQNINLAKLENAQQLGCQTVLNLLKIISLQIKSVPLWLITQATKVVSLGEKNSGICQSTLWGMGKVIAIEHPEYWGGMIDLPEVINQTEIDHLFFALNNLEKEDQIAIRQGKYYVPRLTYLEVNSSNKPLNLNSEGSYLITGGLGALGLKLTENLIQQGAKSLVLLSRRQLTPELEEKISQLASKGAKISVFSADVSDLAQIKQVFQTIKHTLPPLKGVIQAAGIIDDGFLAQQTAEKFARVMKPKVLGTWNLHACTQDLDLDFFICFSSLASLLGSPGQSNYAAANAFLDAIAHYRQSLGLPATSINWGPWAGEGMAQTINFQSQGIELIPVQAGMEIWQRLMNANLAQIGVAQINWQKLAKYNPALPKLPFFSQLLPESTLKLETSASSNSAIYQRLLRLSEKEKQAYLSEYLRNISANILQADYSSISPHDNLLDLGMDSLMVMEAINQLKTDLELMLYPREIYERPRIASLAKYLAKEFDRTHLGRKTEENSRRLQKSDRSITQFATTISQVQDTKLINKQNIRTTLPVLKQKLASSTFILSSPRSGSTLLRVMLAGHPDLYAPPELHLLPFDTMQARQAELGLSQLGEGLKKALMSLKHIKAEESEELIQSLIEENLSIPEVYRLLQQLAGNRILIDKSPTYASNRTTLERAEAIFNQAKYIHLVRHPYSVIESFTRMRMDKLIGADNGNPYEIAEAVWRNSNQNILDFLAQIESNRQHFVRYEDLVSQPTSVLAGVCQFLGVAFDPAVLQPYQGDRMTEGVHHNSLSVGDPNFLQHQQIDPSLAETWQKVKLPNPVSNLTRHLAAQLNYSLPGTPVSAENWTLENMKEILLDVRGLRLCLCSWGPEEGPLVLCLHGILEQGAAWAEVAMGLAQKGYRVIAPDLRGHGRSDHVDRGNSYNLIDFIADIDAIVESLADKAFTLVGHSLGSVIAALFASVRPQKVANLVLVETVLPTESEDEETAIEQLATHLDYLMSPPEHPVFADVAAAAERLREGTPALSPTLAMILAERITEPCEGGVRWRWSPLLRTRAGIGFNGIGKSKYLGILKRIQTPITLIYGDRSNFNRSSDLNDQQAAMPRAEKYVVPGGHNLHLESPSALVRIIESAKALTNRLLP